MPEEDETKEPSLADAWADTLSARSSPASLSSKIHDSDNETQDPSPSERADAWTKTLPPPPPKKRTPNRICALHKSLHQSIRPLPLSKAIKFLCPVDATSLKQLDELVALHCQLHSQHLDVLQSRAPPYQHQSQHQDHHPISKNQSEVLRNFVVVSRHLFLPAKTRGAS